MSRLTLKTFDSFLRRRRKLFVSNIISISPNKDRDNTKFTKETSSREENSTGISGAEFRGFERSRAFARECFRPSFETRKDSTEIIFVFQEIKLRSRANTNIYKVARFS